MKLKEQINHSFEKIVDTFRKRQKELLSRCDLLFKSKNDILNAQFNGLHTLAQDLAQRLDPINSTISDDSATALDLIYFKKQLQGMVKV